MNNDDCNKIVLEIYPKLNIDAVNKIIDDTLLLLSKNIKEFYKESFKYGVEEVLKTVYDKLLNNKSE